MITAINVVTHKEIIGIGNVTSNPEQFQQIVKLAVDITTNGYGTGNGLDVCFSYEYFACLCRQHRNKQLTLSQIVMTSDSESSLHSDTRSIHSSTFSIETLMWSFILASETELARFGAMGAPTDLNLRSDLESILHFMDRGGKKRRKPVKKKKDNDDGLVPSLSEIKKDKHRSCESVCAAQWLYE